MPRKLQQGLNSLRRTILDLGVTVKERVDMAVTAVRDKDATLASQVIERDREIDLKEVEIEEECLKIIALNQPVADDLRFLVTTIKINNDLERIADQAVNISERVEIISRRRTLEFSVDYSEMADKTQRMLKLCLDALVNADVDLAYKVILMDDEVDELKRIIYDKVKDELALHPDHSGYLINLFLISRHLERIGDLAGNIAQEVIYLVEGKIPRHHAA